MSIRNQSTGRSGGHPKSDRLHVNAADATVFLRGLARLLTMAAAQIEDKQTFPQLDGPNVFEGQWWDNGTHAKS